MYIKEYFQYQDKDGIPMIESEQERSKIRSLYPMIKVINSDRLTRNFTNYTSGALKGSVPLADGTPVGFESWVKPYKKPIITEHRTSDFFTKADEPMGRCIISGYKTTKKDLRGDKSESTGLHLHGTGYMAIIASITDEEAARRILSGQYNTVSIGCRAHSVIDSISGTDLIKLIKAGQDMPQYRRGTEYDGRLCYWTMAQITGEELSFVNSPADTEVGVLDPDLNEAFVQGLLAEKVVGKDEFKFYDSISKDLVDISEFEFAFADEYKIVDSYKATEYHFVNFSPEGKELQGNNSADVDSTRNELELRFPNHTLNQIEDWSMEDLKTAIEILSEKSLDEILSEVINEQS